MLTFEEKDHRYFWDGKPVPNVTRVLAGLVDYSMVKPSVLDLARQKGQHVHRLVELWANDNLKEDELPEWMRPVLAEWLKFVDETDFVVVKSEWKLYHPFYKYAGTPDIRGYMRHHPKFKGHGILDLKRSFMAGRATHFQTAAYEHAENAANEDGEQITWRGALKLHEDGPMRFLPHEDKNDFSKFLVCLTYFRIKEEFK